MASGTPARRTVATSTGQVSISVITAHTGLTRRKKRRTTQLSSSGAYANCN